MLAVLEQSYCNYNTFAIKLFFLKPHHTFVNLSSDTHYDEISKPPQELVDVALMRNAEPQQTEHEAVPHYCQTELADDVSS
ncbi:hypothetical protein ROHU_018948 [Labeo rohita]|uniref:Uncharacterized protein n=1 Tax=Labeo rohita TaxID=84645 RepID=A0A498N4B1_LABRO|nr:hypothetical protein ROHU_018948 [Labeo rohita]